MSRPRVCSHLHVDHLAIDEPRAAELVRDHAETLGPKRGSEWHAHFAAVGQRVEHALGLRDGAVVERDRHPMDSLIGHPRRAITGKQGAVAVQRQARMHDAIERVFRRLRGHRRLTEGQHIELAVEYLRIKAHRVSAVAVEGEIGNGLWHGRRPLQDWQETRYFGAVYRPDERPLPDSTDRPK